MRTPAIASTSPQNLQRLRAMGPEGLHRFKRTHKIRRTDPRGPLDDALDQIAAQRDARKSGLYWYTDLDLAIREAHTQGLPILSLRLLGRLDEELSCANSRFFRRLLYPQPAVRRLLSRRFVLHWRSVASAPKIRLDLGQGRVAEGTIAGNSVHLVLDSRGRPVDALPGLLNPDSFVGQLSWAARAARETSSLSGRARQVQLGALHLARLIELWEELQQALIQRGHAQLATEQAERLRAHLSLRPPRGRRYGAMPGDMLDRLQSAFEAVEQALPRPELPRSARRAARRAITKFGVERPLLEALKPPTAHLREDNFRNTFELHRRVHHRFVQAPFSHEGALTEWLYERLFWMPLDDPWLGLVAEFTGLESPRRN